MNGLDLNVMTQMVSVETAAMVAGFLSALWATVIIVAYYILGWCVAYLVNALLKSAFGGLKLEQQMKELGVQNALMGIKITSLIYGLLQFYIIVVFLGAATQRVQLGLVTDVITWLVGYVPSLVKGVIVVGAALIAADFLTNRLKGVQFARAIGLVIKVFVGYTALVIALPFVLPGADTEILKTAFTLAVSSVAVALGLGLGIALGWGLKDTVSDVAKRKKKLLEDLI